MDKKLTVAGSVLWIGGLAATIIGLNLDGTAGTWTAVGGNIAFLVGLGMMGIVWFRKRKNQGRS